MQFHVCLVLAAAVVTTVQEEPRNSTEEPHSDRVFHSPSQAGSDYTSTQEPSGSESGPATPLAGSGSHDSKALQLPEEVGNNGAETSVSHLPETLVLTLKTQTNPGMPEETRGAHTSGRSAFPPVTSSPTRWARLATPAGTTDTIYLQNLSRTSSNEMKHTPDPVWGSTWSRTDLSQSTPKKTRLPDATEGTARFPGSTWTTRDASMVSGRSQNSSGLEDETGTPRLWSRTSAKTDYVDGMGTTTQVLGLGGSPIRTSTPVFLTSSGVLDLSDSKNQTGTPPNTPQAEVLRVGFSENGTERSGLSTDVSTFLSSRWVASSSVSTVSASSEDVTGRSRHTTQAEVMDLGLSQDVMATPEIPTGGGTILASRVPTFSGSEAATIGQLKVSSFGDTEDTTGTPGDFFHGQTETASARVLGFGGSRNTDDTLYTTPTTLKNPASVSPSLLDVLTQAYPSAAPTQITQETLVTEKKVTPDGDTVTTRLLIMEVQSASTPFSSAATRVPKVYVVPDQPATIRGVCANMDRPVCMYRGFWF
ncbi:serine-rich adhesin for platelets isoform X1 [Syngnathus scovelli]|uniref:serine-rich adhesin for platelets isoform X1 n=1 Tax=Syngnathus scovelli TaxID=161590 RepID=UPI0021107973|nr:mucin-3A isoform X1 [Syngnathus scovelli]